MTPRVVAGLGALLLFSPSGCVPEQGEPGEVLATSHSMALTASDALVLGFEAAGLWSSHTATLGLSSSRVQGEHSLSVQGGGYHAIASPPLSSLGALDSTVKLTIELPMQQPNPWWFGDVQMYVNAPSVGLHSQWLGLIPLTGLPVEQFIELELTLPQHVREALSGATYDDLVITVALNLPGGATGTYLVDNLRFGGVGPEPEDDDIEPSDPITDRDVAAFAQAGTWTSSDFPLQFVPSEADANLALEVSANGSGVIRSVPFRPDVGAGTDLTIMVYVPLEQPNPDWYGSLGVQLESTSQGVNLTDLGTLPLHTIADAWNSYRFSMDEALIAALQAGEDWVVTLNLTVPEGADPRAYRIDVLEILEGFSFPPVAVTPDDPEAEEHGTDEEPRDIGPVDVEIKTPPDVKFPGKPAYFTLQQFKDRYGSP